MTKKKRAISLFSGGLDSILAAKLLEKQGIEVVGLHIKTGFHSEDVKERLGILEKNPVKEIAESINLPLIEVDISETYCDVVKNPKYGYGKNANPCIDCKIKFLKTAKEVMEKEGFDFVITGEVLNQRPMSQHLSALKLIEKEADLEGLVLRPLSAKLLPPTIPEKLGWVDREKLLDIRGRGRKKQLELAKEFALEYIPQPSGGCLLTMDEIGKRIFDHLEREEFNCDTARLIPIGRHFRLPSGIKLIVARNKEESQYLREFADKFFLLKPVGKGATALLLTEKEPTEEDLKLSADIVARYSKKEPKEVLVIHKGQNLRKIIGNPADDVLIGQLKLNDRMKNKT